MLTRKQFESVPVIRRRIARDEEELLALEENTPCDIRSATLSLNPTHQSFPKGIDDAMAEYVDKKARYRQSLFDRKKYLLKLLSEIDSYIATLGDQQEQEIVELRCKEGMTFEEIGKKVKYSYRQVSRIYHRAMAKLIKP